MREIVTVVRTYAEWKDHDPTVAERIVEKWNATGPESDWHECTIEGFKGYLAALGFEDPQVYFQGFAHQGQGACWFSDSWVNLREMVDAYKGHEDGSLRAEHWMPDKGCPDCLTGKLDGENCSVCDGTKRVPLPFPEPPLRYKLMLRYGGDVWTGKVQKRDTGFAHHYEHEGTCEFTHAQEFSSHSHTRVRTIMDSWAEAIEQWRQDVCHSMYYWLEREYEYITGEEALAEHFECNEYEFYDDGRLA